MHRAPAFPPKRGALSKAERAQRARAVADSFRAWRSESSAWDATIRAWRPDGAAEIVALDASCFELLPRMSDTAWRAHDALSRAGHIGIIAREQMERAFAEEARLCR